MASWRYTGQYPVIAGADGRIFAFSFIVLFHISLLTLKIFGIILAVFIVIARFGYTVPSAFRRLRSFIAAAERPATSLSWRRSSRRYTR